MGGRVESLRTVEGSMPPGVDGTRSHSAPPMRNEREMFDGLREDD
jgi:hypothetical protein